MVRLGGALRGTIANAMSFSWSSQFSAWGAGLALAVMVAACAPPGEGETPSCQSDKCDDPRQGPTAHARAVLECDSTLDGQLAEPSASPLDAHQKHRACVASANDAVATVIEENIETANAPTRSLEEIDVVFSEFRYASLCTDLEAASAAEPDATALLTARCESIRERSLAELIGALVEFDSDGTGWPLEVSPESFSGCFAEYESALESLGVSEADAALVACAAGELAALAPALTEAYCAQNACVDELVALSFITAGFETAIATSDRACQMLVDAAGLARGGTYTDCRVLAYSELFRSVDTSLGL